MNLKSLTPWPRDGSRVSGSSEPVVPNRPPRILVVDDNEAIRLCVSAALTHAGFDVASANDGQQAWEALLHTHYDLLVTDHEMPRLTGQELIERIREAGMSLPIIVVSGSLAVENMRGSPQLQIAAILHKPFAMRELLDTVKYVLSAACGDSIPGAAFIPAPEVRNRILIVDDDFLVRGSLGAVLECEGFMVDEAGDGIEAVSHAIHNCPALVLLDINMPKMDGWSAFTKLDHVRPLVPVIVITARPRQHKVAVQFGVDAFMEKPLDIPILMRAIKRLTSENENRQARRITNPKFVTQLLDNADC